MTFEEQQFSDELDVFQRECEASSQHLYAYLAICALAKRRIRVLRALARDGLFWSTVLGALQASAILTLGRVFDQDTPHNVDVLLRLARQTPTMFSRPALERRRHDSNQPRPSWLNDFVARAHEPQLKTSAAFAPMLRICDESTKRGTGS